AWAPLSWTGRLTPGVSVDWLPATVPGRAGWVRLHKGPNRIPRLLFRIRLLPSKPLRPFAFEPPHPLLFCADCSSPPQQDGVPRSSPSFPNRGGTEHGAPPAWVESTGGCLGDSSRLGSPRRSTRREICAVYFAHFHRLGAADLFVLPAAAGGFRPPAPAYQAPLHPPDVNLRPLMRDVRGGAALRHSLPPLLHPGEVREGQG